MREFIDKNELDFDTVTTDDYSGNETLDIVLKEDIDNAHVFTVQEILRPYFDKLKQVMKERNEDNGGEPFNAIDKGYNLAFKHMCLEIDKILSEQEHSNGACQEMSL